MRHAITIFGARYTSAMFVWVGSYGLFLSIAGVLPRWFLSNALHGYARCAAAIFGSVGSISKFIWGINNKSFAKVVSGIGDDGFGLVVVFIKLCDIGAFICCYVMMVDSVRVCIT